MDTFVCSFVPMLQSCKREHTVGAYYTLIGVTDTEHRNVLETKDLHATRMGNAL